MTDIDERIPELESKVQALQNEMRERETSVFRAAKTLLTDWIDFQQGRRSDLPRAALIGLLFAWMRPRTVLVAGSIAAALLAGAQIYFLVQQNRLIENQNQFLSEQTRSNSIEAVTGLVANIDESEGVSSAQSTLLQFYAKDYFDILNRLALDDTASAEGIAKILSDLTDQLSQKQASALMVTLSDRYENALGAYSYLKAYGHIGGRNSRQVYDIDNWALQKENDYSDFQSWGIGEKRLMLSRVYISEDQETGLEDSASAKDMQKVHESIEYARSKRSEYIFRAFRWWASSGLGYPDPPEFYKSRPGVVFGTQWDEMREELGGFLQYVYSLCGQELNPYLLTQPNPLLAILQLEETTDVKGQIFARWYSGTCELEK